MTPDAFADKMEEIACLWADQIISASPADAVQGELHVNRFKALTLFLVQTRKLGRKNRGDEDDAGFGAVKARITGEENGEHTQNG